MKKLLEIFKAGKHTASDGSEIEFSAADVEAIAKNYNPELHEAPIVVGHPKSNAPAFGWIKELVVDATSKVLKAVPVQINHEFAEAVKQGFYKKISASFYSPTSPNNPTPGQYYLRHVGFLGAQPPAVKGLASADFAETDVTLDVELDFSDVELAWNDKSIMRMFRNIKNFFIEKYSQEDADRLIPEWEIEGVAAAAQNVIAEENNKTSASSFAEEEQENETLKAELEAEKQKRLEAEQKLEKTKIEQTEQENKEFCEMMLKDGKITPAQKDAVVNLMASLKTTEIEFGENAIPPLEAFKSFVKSLPNAVDFAEVSQAKPSDDIDFNDPMELSSKALKYQAEQSSAGRQINIAQAVRALKEGK